MGIGRKRKRKRKLRRKGGRKREGGEGGESGRRKKGKKEGREGKGVSIFPCFSRLELNYKPTMEALGPTVLPQQTKT